MDGAELEMVAGDDLGDGALEHFGTDAVEPLQEPGGRGAEVRAALGKLYRASCA